MLIAAQSQERKKVWLKYLQKALAAEYIILTFGCPITNEQQWNISASVCLREKSEIYFIQPGYEKMLDLMGESNILYWCRCSNTKV